MVDGRVRHRTLGMVRLVAVLALVSGCGARSRHPGGADGDPDADSDADSDVDSDVDSDADSDTGSDTGGCPPYPDGEYGFQVGDVVQSFTLPGENAGEREAEVGLDDFWCLGHAAEAPATVLVVPICAWFGGICVSVVDPEAQSWHEEYGPRGLAVWELWLGTDFAETQANEVEDAHTHPWGVDEGFYLGSFFSGPSMGKPAYLLVDLADMTLVTTQEGFSGVEESLFEPYLR